MAKAPTTMDGLLKTFYDKLYPTAAVAVDAAAAAAAAAGEVGVPPTEYEFEVKFNTKTHGQGPKIALLDYNNVVRRLSNCKYELENATGVEMLRISLIDNAADHWRVEITGKEHILQYCTDNKLDLNDTAHVRVIAKKHEPADVVEFADFNCRATLSREQPVKLTSEQVKKFETGDKFFRYMTRATMRLPHTYHKVDLTVVKTGRGRSLRKATAATDISVFTAPPTYEIEIEYAADPTLHLPTSAIKPADHIGKVKVDFQRVMSYILSGLQDSLYPISVAEQHTVRRELTQLGLKKDDKWSFFGPKPMPLYSRNLQFVERNAYTVTEKADGERKLLFIANSGRIYFIKMNPELTVQFTGATTKNPQLQRTLLDGEHVTRYKDNKVANLYLIFDIYTVKPPQDGHSGLVYMLPLMCRSDARRQQQQQPPSSSSSSSPVSSRYQLFGQIATQLQEELKQSTTRDRLSIFAKTFYQPNMDRGETIFTMTKKVLQTEFAYAIDGLIFTPACCGVFQDPANVSLRKPPSKTWEHCYKWKEIETVDFKVIWDRFTVGIEVQEVRLQLTEMGSGGRLTPGVPTLLPLTNNVISTVEETPTAITNGDIVEFKYDDGQAERKKWIPIRIRTDKTEPNNLKIYNDMMAHVKTAISKRIMLKGTPSTEEELLPTNAYYSRAGNNTDIQKALREFHNKYVKDKLIAAAVKYSAAAAAAATAGSRSTLRLIDLAAGTANDIHRWNKYHILYVLGIELDATNVKQNYYIDYKDENPDTDLHVTMLHGDSSKEIRYAPHNGLFNKEDKRKVEEIFKTTVQNGFDITSIQFALHYMFKDETTVHGFLRNVQEVTALGGVFVGTCFDGDDVDKQLRLNVAAVRPASPVYDPEHPTFMDTSDITPPVYKIFDDDPDHSLLFSIESNYSNYTTDDMPLTNTLGKEIKVYMKSIGVVHAEYLVHFPFLTVLLKEYGFEPFSPEDLKAAGLPKDQTFEAMYMQMLRQGGKQFKMSKNERDISFLNRFFIFKKVRHLNSDELDQLFMPPPVSAAADAVAEQRPTAAKRKSPEPEPAARVSAAKRPALTPAKFGPTITRVANATVIISALE